MFCMKKLIYNWFCVFIIIFCFDHVEAICVPKSSCTLHKKDFTVCFSKVNILEQFLCYLSVGSLFMYSMQAFCQMVSLVALDWKIDSFWCPMKFVLLAMQVNAKSLEIISIWHHKWNLPNKCVAYIVLSFFMSFKLNFVMYENVCHLFHGMNFM